MIIDTQIEERRNFLKGLGFSIPAAIAAASIPINYPVNANAEELPPIKTMPTAEEIYTLYVYEMMRAVPIYMRDAALERGSVLRMMIETQASSLATVLTSLYPRV